MTAFRASLTIAIFAFLSVCSAQAQIVVKSFQAYGRDTNVEARFHFWINPTTNQVTIEVDNTWAGPGSNNKGTITSFGFNTPFSNSALGTNGSNVTFTQNWLVLAPGRTEPADWNKFEPYQPSQGGGTYYQDIGAGSGSSPTNGSPQSGIRFGEKVKFVFQFPDFTPSQAQTFFSDRPYDLTVRWQAIGECDYSDIGFGCEIPPVPEPSTYGLMGAGALVGLVVLRRRQAKKAATRS